MSYKANKIIYVNGMTCKGCEVKIENKIKQLRGVKSVSADFKDKKVNILLDKDVMNFEDAKTSDLKMFSAYYKDMLQEGIYIAPSQFEALFVSAAHDTAHIDKTIQAAEKVMGELKTS